MWNESMKLFHIYISEIMSVIETGVRAMLCTVFTALQHYTQQRCIILCDMELMKNIIISKLNLQNIFLNVV